jgi:hypothetical protein
MRCRGFDRHNNCHALEIESLKGRTVSPSQTHHEIADEMVLVGTGAYQKALRQIFDTGKGAAPVPVDWTDVQARTSAQDERNNKAVIHVVLIPGFEETIGGIRRVHDAIWSYGWAIEASCMIILPVPSIRQALLELDAFGNAAPRLTFGHLVDEGSHAIVTRSEGLIALASWFTNAGAMTRDSWLEAKRRCSMLEQLYAFLSSRDNLTSEGELSVQELNTIKQIAGCIAWDALGGHDAHAFARRIKNELLEANQPTSSILTDLRVRSEPVQTR